MGKVILDESSLEGIADAIRSRSGSTLTYTPSEMPQAIEDIPDEYREIVRATVNTEAEPYSRNWLAEVTPSENALYIVAPFDYINGTYYGNCYWAYIWRNGSYKYIEVGKPVSISEADIHAITGQSGQYYPDTDNVGY